MIYNPAAMQSMHLNDQSVIVVQALLRVRIAEMAACEHIDHMDKHIHI